MPFINLWYYNDLLNEWKLKTTTDRIQTKDEEKYFKVVSNGNKNFYHSANDYFEHNKPITEKKNVGNTSNITDLNGNIIHMN